MAEVISGMTGALQGSVTGMISRGQNLLDRFFPPEKRNELWAKISKFATEKPMLAVSLFPKFNYPIRASLSLSLSSVSPLFG